MTVTTPRPYLGWEGKSLHSMLDDSARLFDETGTYYGLADMPLRDSDPIRYEKLHSRIRGGVVTARETAAAIAASPLVAQMGELCFSLCTPEGDTVAVSTGIIVHVHTMSEAIKYMIRSDYEDNPGIRDGDIFVNNDPQVSNVHCADVQTMVPIVHNGELIAWAAAVTHEFDIGSRTPGSAAVGPINRFEDGLCLTAQRCGEDDRLYADYQMRCERAVRTPLYWKLDEKTRVAGCHMVRQLVLDVVQDEGVDTFKQFIREAVEDGRRAFQARVRQQLVPGTYRAPVFVDYQFADEVTLPKEAAVDRLLHAPMKVEIPSDGRMHLSLEGANGWGYHSFNCTPEAMHGGLWAFLASTFVSSDPVNDGGWFAIDFQLPPGTWANPDHYMTSHSESWFILTPACNALARPLSRANFSRGYIEEMVAGWGDGNMMQGGALSDIGEGTAICNMEMCCTGAGAGFAQDGLDHASCAWFPAVDMGAVEDWEATEPLVYLGRTIKEDSAGMGRQRGGLGFESLRMVWTDRLLLQNVSDGAVFCNVGLYGGYPSGSGYRHLSKSNNLEELFASRSPYPTADWEQASLAGEEILDNRGVTLLTEFERHDLYLAIIKGGPGVGDPLERVPQAVEADLSSGHLSTRAATEVYGVVAEDAQATAAQREQLRETRRARAVPVREWMTVQRERILRREFAEPVVEMYRSSMQLSDEWAAEYREFWALDEQFEF